MVGYTLEYLQIEQIMKFKRIYQVYRILLNTVSILKYYKDKVLVKKMLSINLITL